MSEWNPKDDDGEDPLLRLIRPPSSEEVEKQQQSCSFASRSSKLTSSLRSFSLSTSHSSATTSNTPSPMVMAGITKPNVDEIVDVLTMNDSATNTEPNQGNANLDNKKLEKLFPTPMSVFGKLPTHTFAFQWIFLFGRRVPSIVVLNEPLIPVDIVKNVIQKNTLFDANDFQLRLHSRSVHLPLATYSQAMELKSKCEDCQFLNIVNILLIRRSDIERIIGEMRIESERVENEMEVWNHDERISICHYNFADLDDDLFDDGDFEEIVSKAATHGWLYHSRKGQRCIVCEECHNKFTPNDFVLHHHNEWTDGESSDDSLDLIHCGLNSNNWAKMIELAEENPPMEHVNIWKQFCDASVAGIKRKHTKAVDEISPMAKLQQKQRRLMGDEKDYYSYDEEAIDDAIMIDSNNEYHKLFQKMLSKTIDEIDLEKAKLNAKKKACSLFSDPSSAFHVVTDKMKANPLKVDPYFGANLIAQQPVGVYSMRVEQQSLPETLFEPLKKSPAKQHKSQVLLGPGGAFYNCEKDVFEKVDMEKCPQPTKIELDVLKLGLKMISQKAAVVTDPIHSTPGWSSVVNEQKLLKTLSEDALNALDGKPIYSKTPKNSPPKPAIVAPVVSRSQVMMEPQLVPFMNDVQRQRQIQNILLNMHQHQQQQQQSLQKLKKRTSR